MSNMKNLNERLQVVENHVNDGNITVMIIGLGSVGTYLLDFLVSKNDPSIKIIVVGRNYEKMESDVNIIKIASLIREAFNVERKRLFPKRRGRLKK